MIATIEVEWSSRVKYAIMALVFGTFGLHRFARGQIKSGIILLIIFGVSVSSIGNPNTISYTLLGISLTALIAIIDVFTMLIQGRFYVDEGNVKTSQMF